MKSIIAFMAIFAIVFCITFIPVKADGTSWSLPFSKIETLLDIAQQLFSGAEVNLAEISGQMLGLYDYILAYEDYIDENGIYVPTLTYDQAQALQLGLSSLALGGEEVLSANSDLTIPIKSSDIANFIGYSTDWIKRYASTDDVIVVSPDTDFLPYLDTINGTGFWFRNYSYTYGSLSMNIDNYNNFTYFVNILSNNIPGAGQWIQLCLTDIQTINITSHNGVYSFTLNVTPINDIGRNGNTDCNVFAPYLNQDRFSLFVGNYSTFTFTQSGTLEQVIEYISKKFRNVNVYVDGVAWSLAGSVDSADPFLQLGTVALGDLGTTTFPVYTLEKDGDLGLDVAAFADWLDAVIKSGATALSLEDLITDGIPVVDTISGERAITDDDEEDVAKVISGVKATTNPSGSPTPTPNPDDDKKTPILKIIPPILELPDSIWPDGGRDTTVLAQIIHSTDVIMPDDIMTILWSIIGVMVVGGLLMILHK